MLDKVYDGSLELLVTTDILLKYEEKIAEIFSADTADLLLGSFSLLDSITRLTIFYHLNIISADVDDNKFVDCAFAGNAHFLVTNDKHYRILSSINFPKINVISLEDFSARLLNN